MTRFSANLSLLFTEAPFLERFAAAREAGFALVECQCPYGVPHEEIARQLRRTGAEMVAFALPGGRGWEGERGVACLPDRREEFCHGVDLALSYAGGTGCRTLICLPGRRPPGLDHAAAWNTLLENVAYAADRCAEHGVALLVQPLNPVDAPGCPLPGVSDTLRLLDDLDGPGAPGGAPTAGVCFDAYHVQRAEGDVTARLAAAFDRVGHVRIADSPGRHQPGTGELNYGFLLEELDRLGYGGAVGLAYRPEPTTEESLRQLRSTLLAPDTPGAPDVQDKERAGL
ncbi:hydroxypyruvate isomerase family protein [Streptomyces sp. NPDC050560]|uniref:hydroxypyruvate isomerase family protein n=1 Tax=Streptomyces sp. NPDC050560 TaxID=3365630 RepID=UPI00379B1D7E